ncbi:MAG: nitroreductase family protein [Candidatus Bathyarchaeota archaeon]|nr:nitroreductase family protein [Candidatus Bathyarchaeota archaeon]
MKNSNLLNVILTRTSIRDFDKNRKVPEEILKQILLAGIRAPSAGNIQPRTFIVVKDDTVKELLYELCENQTFMKDASVWIVVCLDLHRHLKAAKLTGVEYDFTGILPYTFGVLDAALALENMVIAADAFGLGSVIIGSVIEHPQRVKEILKLPENCLALSILCVGYPLKKPAIRGKWGYDVIVCEDRYRDIEAKDVLDYWREFMFNDLKRSGKELAREEFERFLTERSYGRSYSRHYTEAFVKSTNEKLMEFLKAQGFLKE